MGGEAGKYALTGGTGDAFQYVDSKVLNYLFGSTQGALQRCRNNGKFNKVGFIYVGPVRKYNFYDAAKLAYPDLTNYEIAKLRVEINSIMIQDRRKNKAGKSGGEEE